jgi:hypothetical protein
VEEKMPTVYPTKEEICAREIVELRDAGAVDAAQLLVLISPRERTWAELQAAGLSRDRVLLAAGDLAEALGYVIRVGPLWISIVEDDS